MSIWNEIEHQLSQACGLNFHNSLRRSVSGGSINSAYVLEANGASAFVKLNDADKLDMFAAEADGLEEITRTQTVRAPKVLCWGSADHQAYIALEYLQLGHSHHGAAKLGEQLAQMHHCTKPQYGWYRDNTIGSTPQINSYCDDWVEFYQRHRLTYQLALAASKGYRGILQQKGERIIEATPLFFSEYRPEAALLHGDLWGGNFASDNNGQPTIFDPAVYYGDREADIAMTELFGGFGSDFYNTYNNSYPLDPGYRVRKTLYNLYHILNHLNLFGGGYGSQAEHMIDLLLSEVRA